MNLFSSLKYMTDWAFEVGPDLPKHVAFWHPFFSFSVSIFTTIALGHKLANYFEKKFPDLKQQIPTWCKKYVSKILTLYLFVMFSTRYHQNGPACLYEMLWACNLAIVMVIQGIMTDKSILISSAIVMISIDQLLWYLDIIGFIFTKKFVIGVAKYITWPETTKLRLMTSTHHLWFIPLLIIIIKKHKCFPYMVYFFSLIATIYMTVNARLLVPRTINTGNSEIYMNVNLSHEVWKDVPLDFLRIVDNSHPALCISFSNFIWNTGNFLCYQFLKLIIEKIQKLQKKE